MVKKCPSVSNYRTINILRMSKLIKALYITNVCFWFALLIYSLTLLMAYNGVIKDLFIFNCIKPNQFEIIENEKKKNILISFNFIAGNKVYNSEHQISTSAIEENLFSEKDPMICFNSHFPSLKYVFGANVEIRKHKLGIWFSAGFIIFFTLLYGLSNKSFWVGKYSKLST